MSMTEDKAQEISANASGDDGAGAAMTLFFFIGLAASLILGWVIFPKLLYSHKKQPIDFNHVLHMEEVDDGCQSCHWVREDGTFSGIPKLADCMECHEELLGESDEEVKFYEEYVVNNREVPWYVYSKQPDCVFFSHTAHIGPGKMDCAPCHGDHGEPTHLRPYEENRISGYSRDIWGKSMAGFTRDPSKRMKMDVCSDCHVRENVNQNSIQTLKGGCFVCHK